MLPDDDLAPASTVTRCLDCGEETIGDRWRCRLCVAAAHRAIERAGPGATIRPSMIDAERRRDG